MYLLIMSDNNYLDLTDVTDLGFDCEYDRIMQFYKYTTELPDNMTILDLSDLLVVFAAYPVSYNCFLDQFIIDVRN